MDDKLGQENAEKKALKRRSVHQRRKRQIKQENHQLKILLNILHSKKVGKHIFNCVIEKEQDVRKDIAR